jgi:hypothetical protein
MPMNRCLHLEPVMKTSFKLVTVICLWMVIFTFGKLANSTAQESSTASPKRDYSNIVLLGTAEKLLTLEELVSKSWQEMKLLGAVGTLDDYVFSAYLLPCDSVEATRELGEGVPDGTRLYFLFGQRIGRPVYKVFVGKDGKLVVQKTLAVEGELKSQVR